MKLKIVRVIARLNIGGPAIHSILLTQMLDGDLFESILVAGIPEKDEGDMSYLAEKMGVSPKVIAELGRSISWWDDLIAFVKLYRLLRRERPHIIHTHTAKAGTLGRLAAIFAGVPVRIHTFHGHVFHSYFSAFKTKIFLTIERILARFTDKIVVLSPGQKRELWEDFRIASQDKFVVIPLGFDLEPFFECEKKRGTLRRELGLSGDHILVGTVGRLVGVKNHRMFLDAARRISDMEPSAKIAYLVVGGGELKEELLAYRGKLGLDDKVIFTGWKREPDTVYADLDIVALTSDNEGTPVCLIEAMAASRPVVSTRVGGVKDLVREGENGLLVEKGDVDGLAGSILRLARDAGLRRSLGSEGNRFVRTLYSKDRLANDIRGLYEECWKNNQRRHVL